MSDSPRLDAELLLMFVLDRPRSHLFAHPDKELSSEEAASFKSLVGRRLNREPVAYLTGEKEFWSLSLKVTAATLVPRPETELLVEEALALVPENVAMDVIDLGTGSGAIAIALSTERPQCRITASDKSSAALAIAAGNAARHQCDNIAFVQSNWFEAVTGQTFDLIVSNPPYVAADDPAMQQLHCEPRDALVAGKDGLDAIRLIADQAGAHLIEGGQILLEHGAEQEAPVRELLESSGWRVVRCSLDAGGQPRVTQAIRV